MGFKNKYEIVQNFMPDLPTEPFRNGGGMYEGTVAHATASYNDSDEGERNYECGHWHDAFVHFFVDEDSITQVASTDYTCWGAGPTANERFIHVELCQSHDADKFATAYDRYIWLHAYLLYQRGLTVIEGQTLWSHRMVTDTWHESTHTDPDDYLAEHGKSWPDCVNDIVGMYKVCTTEEEEEQMKLEQYQWKMLGDTFDAYYKKGTITDYTWAEKAYKMVLTQSELAFLNTIISARQTGIKV